MHPFLASGDSLRKRIGASKVHAKVVVVKVRYVLLGLTISGRHGYDDNVTQSRL